MAQDKSSVPNLVPFRRAVSGEARARADVPAPEISVGFPEEEAPTASLPKPLLKALLRGTLPTAQEAPLEPAPAPAAVAAPAYSPATPLVSEAPHTPPAPRPVPVELAASATIIVAAPEPAMPKAAEETERIQRRGRPRSRRGRRATVAFLIAAGLLAAAVAGALLWRSEFVEALRGLRALGRAAASDAITALDHTTRMTAK